GGSRLPRLAWSRAVVTSAGSSVPCSQRGCRCDVSTRASFVSSPAPAACWPRTIASMRAPTAVTATRKATTELSQQPVAASNSPQTAPLNAMATAVTASTKEATTELPKQPVTASNKSQKAVRSPNQRNQGRHAPVESGASANAKGEFTPELNDLTTPLIFQPSCHADP